MECSGPQPTGCLFRSAVSALVTRHAHVGGDPCRTMSVPGIKSWWHTTTISFTASSLEDLLLFLTACSADSESERTATAIGAWYRSLKKFNAMKIATNSAVKIETCSNLKIDI